MAGGVRRIREGGVQEGPTRGPWGPWGGGVGGCTGRTASRILVASLLAAAMHPGPVTDASSLPTSVARATTPTPSQVSSREPSLPLDNPLLSSRGSGSPLNDLSGGTLEDIELELDALERELDEAYDARGIAEKVNMQLKGAIEQQSLEIASLQAKINSTRQDLVASGAAANCSGCEEQRAVVKGLCERLESKSREVEKMVAERERTEHALQQARKELRHSRLKLTQVMQDLDKVRVAGGEGVRLVWRCKGQLTNLADEVAALRHRNHRLEKERRLEEIARRKLHNTVQELKGNIRVYCRMRPLIGDLELRGGSIMSSAQEGRMHGRRTLLGESVELTCLDGKRLDGSSRTAEKPHAFTFDKVFATTSTQGDVFEEISALVQSALDGYRVCIFAYGQTGSGKTYTMSAPTLRENSAVLDVEGPDRGVIPRAVQMMFDETERMKERGWTHRIEVSFVEIYNEVLRDLLSLGGSKQEKLDIKHVEQPDGTKIAQRTEEPFRVTRLVTHLRIVNVTHLRTVDVTTAHQVNDLLVQASEARATAFTRFNEQSSRSHSVFVMHIRGTHEATGEVCDGQLNLIDLAGSERLSGGTTKANGGVGEERMRETQAINKSLSSLCDVIQALANKEQHVPFRNSKLTYLLQPSLGGDCKCLMFVNVSPARAHYQETLCSLRFASKVSSVQLRR